MRWRVCQPGEVAKSAKSEKEALQLAMAVSMRAISPGYALDKTLQQTATVWETGEDGIDRKIAHFVAGKRVSPAPKAAGGA
jgi:hypothetical protein